MSGNKKPFGPQYRDAVYELALARSAKHSKLNVLRAILTFCNGTTGQAFPGNAKIMRKAGITSKGTLDTALRWLKQNGIITPVAYETGGYGRSVVWGFCLPAWSTPETVKTSLKNGELLGANYLPKNCNLPPQNSGTTSPIFRDPTELTKLTGNEATPSRREVDKVPDRDVSRETRQFSHFYKVYGNYSEANAALERWKADQTVASE